MSVEIVMPQMGESITEGTISKWMKQVGETVEKDEAILEISTDKVDAEVPSSGAGVLLEIRFKEGETVEVGTVVAVVGEAGETASSSSRSEQVSTITPDPVVEVPAPIIQTPKTASAPATATGPAAAGSATEIVMPQMGESITEGTVSKWLKKVGDAVDKDEPILEISTDKVDAEVPSSAGGTLLEIRFQEGETVEVGTVLALVGAAGAVSSGSGSGSPQVEEKPAVVKAPETASSTASAAVSTNSSVENLRLTKSSPLVRNIAKEHGVDISKIPGSGMSGRVTKQDILSFLDSGAALKPQDLLVKPITPVAKSSAPANASAPSVPAASISPAPVSASDRIEPMSNMRKKIAERMVQSKQTAAHVTTVYEIDMTNIVKFRNANKNDFESRYGTKLTFMPFIFLAVCKSLRQFPIINSQVDGDKIIYTKAILIWGWRFRSTGD